VKRGFVGKTNLKSGVSAAKTIFSNKQAPVSVGRDLQEVSQQRREEERKKSTNYGTLTRPEGSLPPGMRPLPICQD
jgi:hypothetical protein